VKGDTVLGVAGDPGHPVTRGFLCGKVSRYAERLHSPERLRTPLRRAGPKGAGRFVPVGWGEALEEMVRRWQEVIARHGGLALAGYTYSANQGLINRNITQALFNALGGTEVNAGAVCDACCNEAWELTLGKTGGTDPVRVQDSDLIIAWGANVHTTNVHLLPFVNLARKAGGRFVVIDVWRTRAARAADWFLPVRAGTDAALALGIAHVLYRDGLVDREYGRRLVLGADRWAAEVLPRYPPPAVEAITGVPAADLVRLATAYGRARAPFIRLGMGLSRHAGGGTAVRAIACLTGLAGAWRRPGGGALLSTADSYPFNLDAVRCPPPAGRPRRTLNMVRFGRALLEWDDPPLRALFVQGNNPAVTCPHLRLVHQGLAREDLFTVVHDTFLSDTARYADLVLPACTSFESEDLYRSYGSYYVQYGARVLAPVGQAWSNLRLASELAGRLGLADEVFRRSPREHLARLLAPADGAAPAWTPARLLDGEPHRLDVPFLGHHLDERFPTPSGKLQVECPALAARGLPDLPDYRPDEDDAGGDLPLRLITAPGHYLHHTSFAGVASLRRAEGGAPQALLSPADAAAHGIRDGAPAELFNHRGAVGLFARVTPDVPSGVVVVEGHWPKAAYLSGGPLNCLCPDRFTDLGEGSTYQSTRLAVRPLPGGPPAAGRAAASETG
jgi:anaerobic selenocysteine-containing dehydrogenase